MHPNTNNRSEDERTVGYVAQLKPAKKRVSAFDFGGTAASKAGQDDGDGGDGKGKKKKGDGEDGSKFEYREVCVYVFFVSFLQSQSTTNMNKRTHQHQHHRQDWGEKFEGTKEGLGLFLLSLATGRAARVPGVSQ